jgi:hypothetical protein
MNRESVGPHRLRDECIGPKKFNTNWLLYYEIAHKIKKFIIQILEYNPETPT